MSEAGRLEAIGSFIYSRRPGRLQCPNPPAFSDLSKDGVLFPSSVDDNYRQISFGVALAGEMGRHRRFIYTTMDDVETVVVLPGVEKLPGFSHILETVVSNMWEN